ncbi:MAG TPA: thiamine diphosphokinase [Actinobacteria bacterium]|nr:thiamine diphosphokinase [Actinomycetota bacterium]
MKNLNESEKTEVMKMKNCLIISNGEIKDFQKIKSNLENYYDLDKDTLIISADGAVSLCRNMDLCPDIIIGDMDSAAENDIEYFVTINRKAEIIKFSKNKDESDTQLAIDYAVKKGCRQIIIAGALGNRIDHSLANIFNLFSENYNGIDLKIMDENFEISVLRQSTSISGRTGKKISVFSMTPYTFFINTEGLKYKLKNEKLLFSPIRGLSNIFTDDVARMDFSEGVLLIVKEI